ncbi:AAA family ATPase [Candidatus Poribacteria bacterium]|nr:AAA family ATPase [Candidatus Poribacteria bacterium]
MIRFDEVLPKTVKAVESSPIAKTLQSVTVIRDLRGRVRLVFEFSQKPDGTDDLPTDWKNEKTDLEDNLTATLDNYWGRQIWRKGRRKDIAFQAMHDTIDQQRHPWHPPNSSGQLTWYKLERQFSKSSWQPGSVQPPWALGSNTPAIVSFYSFKGGVGRTTTVAAIALLLAQAGKRTLVLDLDLEAPGVGTLLLEGITLPDDGIVDYLVELRLSMSRPANLAIYVTVQNSPDLIDEGELLRVMTAGKLNTNFVEKIARLDFENFVSEEKNPLVELLLHTHQEYDLDFILLDLRSGLHDLGGLSLNGLSHLDVLFGLETEQSWAGLEIVLDVLGQSAPRREVLLVHAMNPPMQSDPDGQAHLRFRDRSYDLFQNHYYTDEENIPDIGDPNAPYGLPITYNPDLMNINLLSNVISILKNPESDYFELARAIGTFLGKDTI